jgi:hypothetical protein
MKNDSVKKGIRIVVPVIMYLLFIVLCINSLAVMLNDYLILTLLGFIGPE